MKYLVNGLKIHIYIGTCYSSTVEFDNDKALNSFLIELLKSTGAVNY